FAHQAEQVIFAIPEVRHPEIVSRHSRDHVGLVFKLYPAGGHIVLHLLNVIDLEVQDGSGMVKFGLFREAQHDANSCAIKKGQSWGGKQELHLEFVAIKRGCGIQVLYGDGDLPNRTKSNFVLLGHGNLLSLPIIERQEKAASRKSLFLGPVLRGRYAVMPAKKRTKRPHAFKPDGETDFRYRNLRVFQHRSRGCESERRQVLVGRGAKDLRKGEKKRIGGQTSDGGKIRKRQWLGPAGRRIIAGWVEPPIQFLPGACFERRDGFSFFERSVIPADHTFQQSMEGLFLLQHA